MRLNQETVLETPRLFMVPYLRVHVPKYHSWMQDSWLRETTSSEQLTLDEEFEAQEQWCNLDDRLTFILLSKQLYQDYWSLNNIKVELDESQLNIHENAEIYSMIGDINLFITYSHTINDFEGELSVMIAESKYRGQGLAAEALAGILEYSGRNLPMKLNSIVAKVSMTNQSSINFFQNRLKFIERSRNNVFNEIEFVPEIQQLPSEDQNQSEYKNLALNTSQLIIDRLLTNSLGSTSKWYYLENDLKLWRQTPRE
uniref:N-acetyltransferase domain-containing protein n=2 Tax=Schistosoma mansoni TaxID=6183 RepID=A0A5K4F0Q8_SCHMA